MRYSVLLAGPKNLILGAHDSESTISVVVIVLRLVRILLFKFGRLARINSFVTSNRISEFGHVVVLGPSSLVERTAGQQARRFLGVVGK